jgi:hypothetical protein
MITPPGTYAPGMRHAAAALRDRADRLGAMAAQLDTTLATMTFAGPAADRFRASSTFTRDELVKLRGLLLQSVETLLQGAAADEAGATRFGGPA